jgi:hypothetical protein
MSLSSPWAAGRVLSHVRVFTIALVTVFLSTAALCALDWTGLAPGVATPLLDIPSAIVLVALVPYLCAVAVVYQRLVKRLPWREAWRVARDHEASVGALTSLAIGVVVARMVLVNAVAWKYGIPIITGFRFDVQLTAIDRWLHGGLLPWQWLSGLLARPSLVLLDRFYAAWYVAFVFVVIREAWAPPSDRQARFFGAFAMVWIVGSVLSVLIPSAGPIYYASVTGDAAAYGHLVVVLHTGPLLATTLQRDLWVAYAEGGSGLVKGIAAFPSLHVAMPALYMVSARGVRERWLWGVFLLLTLVGSIVLGWHYAVDGYAAIVLSMGCWWLARYLVRVTSKRNSPAQPEPASGPARLPAAIT